MEVKLLAISDIHGNLNATSQLAYMASKIDIDAIIISGDLSPFMSIETAREILEILSEADKPIFYVPGNMDDPKLREGVDVKRTECIHGKIVKFKDLEIVGIGGGLIGPFKTPFEYTEDDFRRILNEISQKIYSNKIILVTHNPPHNTSADKLTWGEHVGSVSIRKFIEEKQPLINICGHIHEARSIDRIGRTIIVNVGPLKQGYYAQISIVNESEVNVKLMKLK